MHTSSKYSHHNIVMYRMQDITYLFIVYFCYTLFELKNQMNAHPEFIYKKYSKKVIVYYY